LRRFVLDASVAAKWFLPADQEQYTAEAASIYRMHQENKVRFLVPDVFWVEVANVFWKTSRRGLWTAIQARTALDDLRTLQFDSIESRHLLSLAYTIATEFDRTLYDSVYIALAVTENCEMLTADERLAHATAARLPVRWIGTMSPRP
jgi:predicted nucleic acid-binding protein